MQGHETLTSWVKEYSDDLYRWALHKTLDEDVAKDLLQETFLAATKGFAKFKKKSSPKTWLFSILNNKIYDYYRSNQRVGNKTVSLDEDTAREVSEGWFNESGGWTNHTLDPHWEDDIHLLDNPDFNRIMKMCMDDLPLKWKTAITAKYLIDKDSKTICKELDISTSNYWQIIHRSKLLLRKCIENSWSG
jgi:RNA polymerase sigma-70 factor (ECF subfamily)